MRVLVIGGTGMIGGIDPPFVVGTVPGMKVPMFEAYVQYAEGKFGLPETAPAGGLNFISARSLAEAISGALGRPEAVSGRTILVGDENLTYAEYFGKFFSAVRKIPVKIEVNKEEHPVLPRTALFAGAEILAYEPDAKDVEILGNYHRDDIDNVVNQIVRQYHSD
ncbi:hypothetical protein HYQ45_018829 [Verticillium longisporum]|uniref:Uncharacterized protein n=1 Tax=Verticillium longisporum TaxID=100787 RepID=A0A8I3AV40_VERLO|nr:hypothetical protein HYQ45_018829 [Verticillium longisporum]